MGILHSFTHPRSTYRFAAFFALAFVALAFAALTLPPSTALANAPGTPSHVSLTRADGNLTASWPAVSGATTYHVTYSSNGGSSWSLAALYHAGTSITIAVSNDASYIVGVRAKNADDEWGGWRNSPSIDPYKPKPVPAPATPSRLTATPGDSSATLTWDDPSNSTIARYEYRYRKAPPSAGWGAWTTVPNSDSATTSFQMTGLTNGTEYRFKLRAVNSGGVSRAAPTVAPWYVATVPDEVTHAPSPINPPAAPTGLTATAGNGSATLAWDAPSNSSITGYEVQTRWTGVAWGAWAAISGGSADTTSHTIEGLTNGTEYRFKLRAVNSAGNGAIAPNAAPWYVAATPVAPPKKPSGLEVTGGANGSANLSWTNPNNNEITGYQYQMREDGGAWGQQTPIGGSGAGTTNHQINGLTGGQTYHFNLQALGAGGASRGAQTSTRIPNYLPGPETVTITARGTGTLSATWTEVPGAFRYFVYTSNSGDNWANYTIEDSTTGTSITLNNRNDNLNYTVLVRASTDYGITIKTESHPAGTLTSPAIAPESVSLSRSGTTLTATWPAVVGAASYNVDIRKDNANTWTPQATAITTTTWTKTGIDPNSNYTVRVQSKNSAGTSGWTESDENTPSPPPASVTLGTRTSTTLNVSWTAVTGATGYFAQTSTDNGLNWSADTSVTGTTTALAIDSTKDYFVRVQTNSSAGRGDRWTTSAISRAIPLPPAPANLSATRAKGSITITWDAATGAGSYDIACSVFGGYFWEVCKEGVTNSERSSGVTFTHYYNRTAGRTNPINDNREYLFAVRGRNTSGAGEWTREFFWPAVPEQIASVNAVRTSTEITLTMTVPPANGGYSITRMHVDCRTSSNGGTTWSGWFKCTNAETQGAPTSGATFTAVIDSLDSYDNTLTYQARARARNALGASWDWRESAVNLPISVSNIATTSATLTIANHSGNWYVKETAPSTGTCSSAITGATHGLSSLTAGTRYTYKAYSDSACANEIGAVAFSTAVTVSNLGQSNASNTLAIQSGKAKAQEFTTGSEAGGYTLSSVTLNVEVVLNASVATVTLRERQSNGHPATTSLATLSGTMGTGNRTFTCSGAGCALSPDTQYFIYVSSSSGYAAIMNTTTSDAEALQPSGNGWSIANDVRAQDNGWGHWVNSVSMKVSVTAVPNAQ